MGVGGEGAKRGLITLIASVASRADLGVCFYLYNIFYLLAVVEASIILETAVQTQARGVKGTEQNLHSSP